MELLRIGKLAEAAAVGVETIRYYERSGLLPKPERQDSGYREYTRDHLLRLRFIKKAKGLGFTLAEIKDLLSLGLEPRVSCAIVRERTVHKMQDIETKIRTLESMQGALAELVRACDGSGTVSKCPILQMLENEDEQD